jgi:hypothetical protein
MRALYLTTKCLVTLLLSAALLPGALAQPKPAAPPVAAPASMPSDEEVAAIREQTLALLRMSPTLAQVIETDPTILSDQNYLTRVNPSLAQFLTQHPEVVRNPDFFLFSSIPSLRGKRIDSLHRRNGNNNFNEPPTDAEIHQRSVESLMPFVVFVIFMGALIWLIRLLLENRRWGRVFRLQSEVHAKLIDRFANNQELLHYMETEPGKRFLEAAPIPVAVDRTQPFPGGLARVLGPLQFGIVLTLLGTGLLILQHSLPDIADGLLVFGMVALMPGLGFIISALIAWRISARLGLMPQPSTTPPTELHGQQ